MDATRDEQTHEPKDQGPCNGPLGRYISVKWQDRDGLPRYLYPQTIMELDHWLCAALYGGSTVEVRAELLAASKVKGFEFSDKAPCGFDPRALVPDEENRAMPYKSTRCRFAEAGNVTPNTAKEPATRIAMADGQVAEGAAKLSLSADQLELLIQAKIMKRQ